MTVPSVVETARLRLRRFRAADVDSYAKLCGDPVVMEWLDEPMDRAQSAAQLTAFREHWAEHGFRLWCVTEPPDDTCIGFIGLAIPRFAPELIPAVEVGWRLAHDAWGRGYATEGASSAVDIAFGRLALEQLVSVTRIENRRSWHVMEKLGMTFERNAVHAGRGTELIVYGLDAPR